MVEQLAIWGSVIAGLIVGGYLGHRQGHHSGYLNGFTKGHLNRPLERGDTVRLKSGGPPWTVTEVKDDDVTCVRWTGTRPNASGETVETATFKRWLLRKEVGRCNHTTARSCAASKLPWKTWLSRAQSIPMNMRKSNSNTSAPKPLSSAS